MARARCRRQRYVPGVMNSLETAYATILEAEKSRGEILWWAFESVTLKLAKDCRYTPDFFVLLADGTPEFREVKGGRKKKNGAITYYARDDAKAKFRVAASKFWMYQFAVLYRSPKSCGEAWIREDVSDA